MCSVSRQPQVQDLEHFDGLFETIPAPYYYPNHFESAKEFYAKGKKKTGQNNPKKGKNPPVTPTAPRSLPGGRPNPLADSTRQLTILEVAHAVWGEGGIMDQRRKQGKTN
eukprot:1375067-Amorphochlora_amoeboformis.AAC.2